MKGRLGRRGALPYSMRPSFSVAILLQIRGAVNLTSMRSKMRDNHFAAHFRSLGMASSPKGVYFIMLSIDQSGEMKI